MDGNQLGEQQKNQSIALQALIERMKQQLSWAHEREAQMAGEIAVLQDMIKRRDAEIGKLKAAIEEANNKAIKPPSKSE